MSLTPKTKSVLYVGQCYYNHWYLSRELRKLGWKADLVNIDFDDSNSNYYHGEDFNFAKPEFQLFSKRLEVFLGGIKDSDIFHFSSTRNIYFFYEFRSLNLNGPIKKNAISGLFWLLLKLIIFKNKKNLLRIYSLLGNKLTSKLILRFKDYLPPRWDIWIIKLFNKKVFYSNNGCQDGVLKSSFAKWSTPTGKSVCSICPWENNPIICSEERSQEWGEFRNAVIDFHANTGNNKVDYNATPLTHETPWLFCLDKDFWRPNLMIPTNFKLTGLENKVKILHAVGNFDTRSNKNNQTIKSTHIYLPLIEKLKKQGYNVELIFFNGVSNKDFRYYQLQADIIVDMLSFGFFGANLREGMMLGKPCVCYLRPSWMKEMHEEIPDYVDELPIVNANENNIQEVLIDLIENKEKRESIGRKSREFAVKWHSSDAAAEKFDKLYQQFLQ